LDFNANVKINYYVILFHNNDVIQALIKHRFQSNRF